MVPTVWWYMNTTLPTLEKREERRQGSDAMPKKFLGTWDEFASVLAGKLQDNKVLQRIIISDSILRLNYKLSTPPTSFLFL